MAEFDKLPIGGSVLGADCPLRVPHGAELPKVLDVPQTGLLGEAVARFHGFGNRRLNPPVINGVLLARTLPEMAIPLSEYDNVDYDIYVASAFPVTHQNSRRGQWSGRIPYELRRTELLHLHLVGVPRSEAGKRKPRPLVAARLRYLSGECTGGRAGQLQCRCSPSPTRARLCGLWEGTPDPDDGERIIAFPLARPANKIAV